ncbi:MAG: D-aminoacylase [Cyclobacteriaceae bacterium]|nr:D-aminoacylase [Cyclobacteriaceae bacterium]
MRTMTFLLSLLAATLLFGCQQEYDLIIKNGMVYDGSGNPPTQTDVAITKDKIVKVGNLSSAKAKRIIDATGLAVAPGFIDLHAHLDPLLNLPSAESAIRQGVTTSLGGPDGSSPWPLGAYLDKADSIGMTMNVAFLIGHNTIRRNVMKLENRAPTDEELATMEAQVEQGMKEGAFGLSTGLKYIPGAFSNVDEVIALAKVASKYNGIYTSHLREEGIGLLEAVYEAIEIGRAANIPIILTHHKAIGTKMWGASVKTLAMVDSARKIGIDVMMDQYPYNASYTGIGVLIPSWSMAGGTPEFKKRLDNPLLRDSIKKAIVNNILYDRGGADLNRIQFALVEWKKDLEGRTLRDWLVERKIEPTVENGAELVIEAQLNGGANCVYFAMDDADVERIMKHPQTMIGSDGRLVAPGDGHPHPRWYGTFPRVLGVYVREKGVLTLENAIQKMTMMSADRLGLKDRGRIKENTFADVVVFNPQTVKDKSTFQNPHQYPDGIDYVVVNGTLAVDKGKFIDARTGMVLRKGSK